MGHASPASASVARRVQLEEQAALHSQEQRGVTSLSNAAAAVTVSQGIAGLRPGASPRATPLPVPDGGLADAPGAEGAPGMEKRGPVEFNHAISYVNKIKVSISTTTDPTIVSRCLGLGIVRLSVPIEPLNNCTHPPAPSLHCLPPHYLS
jgi:hypothetical protein